MWVTICIIAVVVIIILAIIAMYNNLVSLRMRVKNAWAQVNTQLKRRFDLIPNLVETVKKYASHEEETLQKVTELRNSYSSASSVDEKSEINNKLNANLKNIFAIAESYPDLKANQNFLSLQNELSETEDKIAYCRQFYNDTVQIYNTAIMKFPTNLFAKIFGFVAEEFFKIDENEKNNVKVQF